MKLGADLEFLVPLIDPNHVGSAIGVMKAFDFGLLPNAVKVAPILTFDADAVVPIQSAGLSAVALITAMGGVACADWGRLIAAKELMRLAAGDLGRPSAPSSPKDFWSYYEALVGKAYQSASFVLSASPPNFDGLSGYLSVDDFYVSRRTTRSILRKFGETFDFQIADDSQVLAQARQTLITLVDGCARVRTRSASANAKPLDDSSTHDWVHGFLLLTGVSPPARAFRPCLAASRPPFWMERSDGSNRRSAPRRDLLDARLLRPHGRSLPRCLSIGEAVARRPVVGGRGRIHLGRRAAGRTVCRSGFRQMGDHILVVSGPRSPRSHTSTCLVSTHVR